MPKPTLFICKSYHRFSKERPEHQPTDGTQLLEQLHTLCAERSQSNELEIQPVDCLWTCDKPCAVAFSAPHKPTYLFTNLPTDETAAALLEFGKRYLSSKAGDIPWKQFPEVLQSVSIAKIPVVKAGNRWANEWMDGLGAIVPLLNGIYAKLWQVQSGMG